MSGTEPMTMHILTRLSPLAGNGELDGIDNNEELGQACLDIMCAAHLPVDVSIAANVTVTPAIDVMEPSLAEHQGVPKGEHGAIQVALEPKDEEQLDGEPEVSSSTSIIDEEMLLLPHKEEAAHNAGDAPAPSVDSSLISNTSEPQPLLSLHTAEHDFPQQEHQPQPQPKTHPPVPIVQNPPQQQQVQPTAHSAMVLALEEHLRGLQLDDIEFWLLAAEHLKRGLTGDLDEIMGPAGRLAMEERQYSHFPRASERNQAHLTNQWDTGMSGASSAPERRAAVTLTPEEQLQQEICK
ncbi:hypothetical protein DACRYDRAFT_14361 [Dacryopinax primogenitus]|uniref:Uncharacterized protein n=1 Tax=Dacryopinax primogenitus (strain DJM 731) TaxID=1858805 RepID=M5G1Z3_DACPD|nr:uncharacterized protein DACRYDRAFT_14361 [Dacryopinax primogenitus]EJU04201.1 hypothetical protein DACRYDRAFT_14361 [Dacryopinax primogenitus]